MTIFHQLMSPEAYRNGTVPSAGSLYEEGQALMFAGADTVGNTLMLGTYYLLRQPETYQNLKKELMATWPSLESSPDMRTLDSLPYLNAVIKESLRMSSGVVSGLLRFVPPQGARIAGTFVPGGVSCSGSLNHHGRMRKADLIRRQSSPAAAPLCTTTLAYFLVRTPSSPNDGYKTVL